MKKILVVVFAFLLLIIIVLIGLSKNKKVDLNPQSLPKSSFSTSGDNLKITPADLPLKVSSGYVIGIFAGNVPGARDLQFSPQGTLLVSQTSSGRVVALPTKGGLADSVKNVLVGLDRPHGLTFYNGKLYVAQESKLVRYNWDEQNLKASEDKILFNIPAGGRHFTRSIVFDSLGKLYVTIGSSCDVCNEKDPYLAAVVVSDADGNNPRVFSKGLRNSVFLTLNEATNEVWVTEMGRDFLGDNLPPDEVNILADGKNYGWPNCYGDKIPDTNFNAGTTKSSCGSTQAPIYKIPAHSAPLGLTFINSKQFAPWQGDLLVSYHGSWNRSVPDGYKVVRMKVSGNKILSEEDFITGFIEGRQVIGRPVDLTFDSMGNLYISDDRRGAVYIVGKK